MRLFARFSLEFSFLSSFFSVFFFSMLHVTIVLLSFRFSSSLSCLSFDLLLLEFITFRSMPHGTMFLSFTIFYLPSFSTFLDSSLQDSTLANANFLSFLSLIRLLLGFVGFDLMAFFLLDELEYMIDDDFDMAEFEDDDPFEEQNQKLTIGDASDSEDDDDLDKVFFFFFFSERA